jgi:hypothetical protein
MEDAPGMSVETSGMHPLSPFPAAVLTALTVSTRPPVNLKIGERSGNVIENKQPLRKTIGRSGNVIENTCT